MQHLPLLASGKRWAAECRLRSQLSAVIPAPRVSVLPPVSSPNTHTLATGKGMPPCTLSPRLPLDGLTLDEQKTTALLCLCTPEAGLGKAPHSPSQAHTQEPCNEVTKKKKILCFDYVYDSGLSRIHRYPGVPAAHGGHRLDAPSLEPR